MAALPSRREEEVPSLPPLPTRLEGRTTAVDSVNANCVCGGGVFRLLRGAGGSTGGSSVAGDAAATGGLLLLGGGDMGRGTGAAAAEEEGAAPSAMG